MRERVWLMIRGERVGGYGGGYIVGFLFSYFLFLVSIGRGSLGRRWI